ncbi:MAG: hypothetical protein GY794_19240, partial [bacterium]|nr:hypothetical protein [bacterium]
MAYRCEKCGREWDKQTAAENEFLCTRRCGGQCVEVADKVPPGQNDPPPRKVYIELTTDCNMDCPMCLRHSWDSPGGAMS